MSAVLRNKKVSYFGTFVKAVLKAVLKLGIKRQRHYRTLHYSLERSVPAESASESILVLLKHAKQG